ncbi:MAG TPA: hypothetical protein VKA31_01865 [Mariprofundaceae bacterium]|nr:hypothetical protein [Mariprofundaceae bacterium]
MIFGIVWLMIAGALPLVVQADEARQQVPWLDLPAGWSGTTENGIISMTPGDLSFFDSLVLRVEPLSSSRATLAEDYEQALRDLGPWRPIGNPVEQRFDTGWIFRMGVGVATLNGTSYTAETAIARHGGQRVRFWVLADSDGTFNRYKAVFANAISSAQDITLKQAPAVAASNKPAPAVQGNIGNFKLVPGFGKGLSGVYVGLERGLSAHAGYGIGDVSNSIEDYTEVDVLFPDGAYRRRLPYRGMNSDLRWDRQTWATFWGTWKQQGDKVVIARGSYTTYYTTGKPGTLISDRDRPWSKLAIPAKVRVEGTFARANRRDADVPRITLHADGRYEEHGNFLSTVGDPWELVVPDGNAMFRQWSSAQYNRAMAGSSGTYTFDSYTLTFHTSDGRIWQINAYIPPGESMKSPRKLVINGVQLLKD